MATTQWLQSNHLATYIKKSFAKFNFFQLVYILDVLSQAENKAASDRHFLLTHHYIKFSSQIDLHYQSDAITNFTETADGYHIEINFTGLMGPGGLLPAPYSADLIEQDANTGLLDFLNIFNHRMISLYYLAWQKYRVYLTHKLDLSADLARLLKYFCGLLPAGQQISALPLNLQNTLLYFSGFNSKSVRTLEGLECLLQHYFSVPITIEPFKGRWIALATDTRSNLPSATNPDGQFNTLSKDCVIGQRVWHSQNHFCIVIKLQSNDQFARLLADSKTMAQLRQLITLYLGATYQFSIRILLSAEIKVRCQLSKTAAPILAWNCWCNTNQWVEKEFTI